MWGRQQLGVNFSLCSSLFSVQKCLHEKFRCILVVAWSFPLLPSLSCPFLLHKICSQWILCENHPLWKETLRVSCTNVLLVQIVAGSMKSLVCGVGEMKLLWNMGTEDVLVLIPIFSCKDLSGPALEEIPSAENCWMLEEVFRRTIIYTFLFLFHSYVYLWPLMETGQLARWSLGHCYILRHFYLHWLLPRKDSPDGSGAGDSPYYVMGSLTWQQSLQKNF